MDVAYKVEWRAEDRGLHHQDAQRYSDEDASVFQRQHLNPAPLSVEHLSAPIGISSCAAAWSVQNLLALVFKLPEKLLSSDAKETIAIVYPDEPWNITRISSLHSHPVCMLRWDASAPCRLLSVDIAGHCCVWSPKDKFINLWQLKWELASPLVPSQPLAAQWLQQASVTSIPQPFSPWMMESGHNEGSPLDQFTRFSPKSILPHRAATGWLLALNSGKVTLCVARNCGVQTSSLQLVASRTKLEAADIALHSDGSTIVAVASSCSKVQIFRLDFEAASDLSPTGINMSSESLATIDTSSSTCPKPFVGCVSWLRLYSGTDLKTIGLTMSLAGSSKSIVYGWRMCIPGVDNTCATSLRTESTGASADSAACVSASASSPPSVQAPVQQDTSFSTATRRHVHVSCSHHYESNTIFMDAAIPSPTYVAPARSTTLLSPASSSATGHLQGSSSTTTTNSSKCGGTERCSIITGGISSTSTSTNGNSNRCSGGNTSTSTTTTGFSTVTSSSNGGSNIISSRIATVAMGSSCSSQSVCLGDMLACIGQDGTITLLERSTLTVRSQCPFPATTSSCQGWKQQQEQQCALSKESGSDSSPCAAAVACFSPSQCCLGVVDYQGALVIFQLAKTLLPLPNISDLVSVDSRTECILQMLTRSLIAGHNPWDVLTLAVCGEDGPLVIDKLVHHWCKLRPLLCRTDILAKSHTGFLLDILTCSSSDSHRQSSVHVHFELLVDSFMAWIREQLQQTMSTSHVDDDDDDDEKRDEQRNQQHDGSDRDQQDGALLNTDCSTVRDWDTMIELCQQPEFLLLDILVQKLDMKMLTLKEDILSSVQPIIHGILIYTLRLTQPEYSPLSAKCLGNVTVSLTMLLKLRQFLLLVHIWSTCSPGILSFLSSIAAADQGVSILFKQISKLYVQHSDAPGDLSDIGDDGVFLSAPQGRCAAPVALRHGYHARVHKTIVSASVKPHESSQRQQPEQAKPVSLCYAGVGEFHFLWPPTDTGISSSIGPVIRDPLSSSSLRPPASAEFAAAALHGSQHFSMDSIQFLALDAHNSTVQQQTRNGIRQCSRCSSYSSLLPFTSLLAASSWLESWSHSCLCGGQWKHMSECSTT